LVGHDAFDDVNVDFFVTGGALGNQWLYSTYKLRMVTINHILNDLQLLPYLLSPILFYLAIGHWDDEPEEARVSEDHFAYENVVHFYHEAVGVLEAGDVTEDHS